ncbi:MAG: NAD(P)-dependent alcohol dehydrogenase [bacterium]|nr:NAD(P)-dependent alcohol dehydrogenase [bacterium]
MKAIVCPKYGSPDVLQLKEVETPIPKKNEVRIKIITTTVTASDCIVRGFKLSRWSPIGFLMGLIVGFTKPRRSILGLVLAGEIESLGKDVKKFKKGDQVYAYTDLRMGAYAEYTCLPENGVIALKPVNLTFEEAVAIPYGGLLALHFIEKANVQNGQKVLIYGASGAVGTSAVQLARYFGAEVTGICSTVNLEMVKSLGAAKVLDYTKEDFTEQGEKYDLVFNAVGKKKVQLQCKKVLTPDGKHITVDDGTPTHHVEGLMLLKKLAEEGHLKPVVDSSYPLEQMVEAHRYVDKGHKKGNVVIKI